MRMILLLFGVSAISFMLVISSPIDPVEAFVGSESNISKEQKEIVAEYWGLDQPPLQRYLTWLKNLFHGDMGDSIAYKKPVTQVLAERFATSCVLMLTAWLISGALGFVLGILAGICSGKWPDKIIKTFCFVLSSTPAFWMGLLLLVIFAVNLGWFPVGFAVPVGKSAADVTIGERIHHLILPALTLSITGVANIALHTRQKIIDVMKSRYVLFAKARGENTWQILKRHGLRKDRKSVV